MVAQAGLIFNLSSIPLVNWETSSISENKSSQETTTPLPIKERDSSWQIDEGNKCKTNFLSLTIKVSLYKLFLWKGYQLFFLDYSKIQRDNNK